MKFFGSIAASVACPKERAVKIVEVRMVGNRQMMALQRGDGKDGEDEFKT